MIKIINMFIRKKVYNVFTIQKSIYKLRNTLNK